MANPRETGINPGINLSAPVSLDNRYITQALNSLQIQTLRPGRLLSRRDFLKLSGVFTLWSAVPDGLRPRSPALARTGEVPLDPIGVVDNLDTIGGYTISGPGQTPGDSTFSFSSKLIDTFTPVHTQNEKYVQIDITGLSRQEGNALGGIFEINRKIADLNKLAIKVIEEGGKAAGTGLAVASLVSLPQEQFEKMLRHKEQVGILKGAALVGGLGAGAVVIGLAVLYSQRESAAALLSSQTRNIMTATATLQSVGAGNLPAEGESTINTPVGTAILKVNTATPSPTNTLTITPTRTETPTRTAIFTPKETPIPTEVVNILHSWTCPFNLNYNGNISWDDPNWTSIKDNGGATVEVVDYDPIMGGPVFVYTVKQDRSAENQLRLYTVKNFPHIDKSRLTTLDWRYEVQFVFDPDYLPHIDGEGVSIMSSFDRIQDLDGKFRVIASIDMGQNHKPVISVKEPNTGEEKTKYRTNREVLPNKRYDGALFKKASKIGFEMNGTVWAQGVLPDDYLLAEPVFSHAGAYGNGSKIGSRIMNGKQTVKILV